MNSRFNDVTVARKCRHADKGKNIKIKTYSHIGTRTPRWFSWLLMWWFPSSAPVKLFDVLHSGTDKGKQEVLWVEKQPNQPGKLSENNSPRCLWHRDLQSLIQDGIPEPTSAHSTISLQNHRTRSKEPQDNFWKSIISFCALFSDWWENRATTLLQRKFQSESILLSKSPQCSKAACRKLSGPLDYSELDEVGSAHGPRPAPQDTNPTVKTRTVENESLRQNNHKFWHNPQSTHS